MNCSLAAPRSRTFLCPAIVQIIRRLRRTCQAARSEFSPSSIAALPLCALCVLLWQSGRAQDNYEIQVYGSETVPAGRTMVELHSNYTISGERDIVNGVFPSEHALHETLEITHGF